MLYDKLKGKIILVWQETESHIVMSDTLKKNLTLWKISCDSKADNQSLFPFILLWIGNYLPSITWACRLYYSAGLYFSDNFLLSRTLSIAIKTQSCLSIWGTLTYPKGIPLTLLSFLTVLSLISSWYFYSVYWHL